MGEVFLVVNGREIGEYVRIWRYIFEADGTEGVMWLFVGGAWSKLEVFFEDCGYFMGVDVA